MIVDRERDVRYATLVQCVPAGFIRQHLNLIWVDDFLIADIRMPGMSGLELQAKLNAEHCRIVLAAMGYHFRKLTDQYCG